MKAYYTIQVELTLEGPILTSGGEMSEPGIDAPMARDHLGRFMLPFSLVKGKVRDAFNDLGAKDKEGVFNDIATLERIGTTPAQLDEWLGQKCHDGQFDPERGLLRVTDFVTDNPGGKRVIDRIQLDQETGSVAGRMLQMVEAPFDYGEHVTFRGEIEFAAASPKNAKDIATAVDQALRWIPAFGAYRTIGFGRTHSVKVHDPVAVPNQATGRADSTDVLSYSMALDRPLCVVGKKHSRNHFESEEVISGAVLKGTVARMIVELSGREAKFVGLGTSADFPELCEHFEKIRFAEARPRGVESKTRPIEPPLSIVTSPAAVAKGGIYDVALATGPCLIHGAAPAFRPDWKDHEASRVRAYFGWSDLPRERRTRTAIDENTWRAKDEQLFSYGLVLPSRKSGDSTESFVWDGNIGLESVPANSRAAVRDQLVKLLSLGIRGIGKSRAVGRLSWKTVTAEGNRTFAVGATVVVTLQTEFLMTDPELLQGANARSLSEAYAAFWHEASSGSLKLVRYFARQSLQGGFLSQRSFGKGKYEPFLVTDRGSVFVLEVVGENAGQRLDDWITVGLPVPAWVRTRYQSEDRSGQPRPLWQTCPFLPHAGYGEIALNLPCHQQPLTDITKGDE